MLRLLQAKRTSVRAGDFNGHPPLGVNATAVGDDDIPRTLVGFNGHPPLGVNATLSLEGVGRRGRMGFNGHPPLGVNATREHHPLR